MSYQFHQRARRDGQAQHLWSSPPSSVWWQRPQLDCTGVLPSSSKFLTNVSNLVRRYLISSPWIILGQLLVLFWILSSPPTIGRVWRHQHPILELVWTPVYYLFLFRGLLSLAVLEGIWTEPCWFCTLYGLSRSLKRYLGPIGSAPFRLLLFLSSYIGPIYLLHTYAPSWSSPFPAFVIVLSPFVLEESRTSDQSVVYLFVGFLFVLIPWRHGRLVFESIVVLVWFALARQERCGWHGCDQAGRRRRGAKTRRKDDGVSEEEKAEMVQQLLQEMLFEAMLQAERDRAGGSGSGPTSGRGGAGGGWDEGGHEEEEEVPRAKNARKKKGRRRR